MASSGKRKTTMAKLMREAKLRERKAEKNERKQDQANFIQSLLQLAPYTANLEYRGAVGPAAVHEKEAELFYVIDGSGTLVTGGKLVGETRTNAENLNGTAIDPATSYQVTTNDFLANGGDGFTNLTLGTGRVTAPGFDVDALVAYLTAAPVSPTAANRITRLP